MMIDKIIQGVRVAVVMLLMFACSSVESDAKKAASLINKSMEQTQNLQLDKAEKTYLKAQDILKKYADDDKKIEFYECFVEYRDK